MAKKKKEKRDKKRTGVIKVGFKKKQLIRMIHDMLVENPTQTLNYKQVAAVLDIKDMTVKRQIVEILYEMKDNGMVLETQMGKFKLLSADKFYTGTVDMTARGSGYIICKDLETDIHVPSEDMNHALHGDTVMISLSGGSKDKKPEGKVVEIVKRKKMTFVGTIDVSPKFAFVLTASKNMPHDIFIPVKGINGARHGDKVIAQITEWPKTSKNPVGRIETVLGKPGDNDTEMHAILAEFDLPIEFPSRVEDAADLIPTEITEEEIAKRRDFRKITTLTIDPADAKDFDDALSVQKLENGNWEIGVHIADVTHYVTHDTIIEKEAYDRATSVYLVDRVVPMLPEHLSNGVCSLRPNEEKLCFSTVFELNDNAEVLSTWYGKTVIESDRRFTYEDAQSIIETREGEFKEEILKLDELAKLLRKDRFNNGAINFDRVEVKFDLDKKGKPLSVFFKESKDANKLVEEFMLLANKKVAEFIGKVGKTKKAKTFVYRIHDKPNPEKLATFSKFIRKFGYDLKTDKPSAISSSLNKLMEDVKGDKIQDLVETLAIRSMSKATYSTKNIGHYGLHFDHYSHFTSPIRRYPDMMVHRLLDSYINGVKSADAEKFEERCEHSSEMEQRAANAERASIKYKQVEFMTEHIGEVFEGSISGVSDWGIYVEINSNKCEGMVALRDMNDDHYEFDKENYCITGMHTHKKYQLGDTINIKVVSANLVAKQLDFVMAD